MRRMMLAVLAAGLVLAARPCAAQDAIFGAGIAVSGDLSPFPQWRALVEKLRQSEQGASQSAQPWTQFLSGLQGKSWFETIEAANRRANARPYVEDWMNWGVGDYWETPDEFVRRGGDCEDYAIAKYFSLIRLGVRPSDLRIVVVYDRNLDASHALVAVRHDGQTWLLDIGVDRPIPPAEAPQYTPVYALARDGWWLYPPVLAATPDNSHS